MNAPHPLPAAKGRKYEQVLQGAREVFLGAGFEAASMDEIARQAEVSKATLYSYFNDKSHLFVQVVQMECARQAEIASARMDPKASPQAVLTIAARHLLDFMTSDFGQRMCRICVAEVERFPQLGADFYASGPETVRRHLIEYFTSAVAQGDLEIRDFDLAAGQFAELCKAEIFPRILFRVQTVFSDAEIDRIATGAVETFLARYCPAR